MHEPVSSVHWEPYETLVRYNASQDVKFVAFTQVSHFQFDKYYKSTLLLTQYEW